VCLPTSPSLNVAYALRKSHSSARRKFRASYVANMELADTECMEIADSKRIKLLAILQCNCTAMCAHARLFCAATRRCLSRR